MQNIYISLDEAREEIKERWNDVELKKKIEEELGDKFMIAFKDSPRGITFRQICSPDNGFTFFYQSSRYVGVEPLVIEYFDDIFTHLNEEKKGLGRLRVILNNEEKAVVDIMNFHENEKKKLGECVIKSGKRLVEFHKNLFDISGYQVDFVENSKWFHNIGRASDYYYYFLLHFIAHGILFETFFDEGGSVEDAFTKEVISPALEKIEAEFGVKPLIVRSYPKHQDNEEGFYWWSYPPSVNKHIVEYANDGNIAPKIIKILK